MHVAGSNKVDERDIPLNVTGPRPYVAVDVPRSPGTAGGAGVPAHVGSQLEETLSGQEAR
jgi:hypothetical protein